MICREGGGGQVGAKQRSKAQVEAFRLPFWIRLYRKSIAAVSLMRIILELSSQVYMHLYVCTCMYYMCTYTYWFDFCTSSFTELFFSYPGLDVFCSFSQILSKCPCVGCFACKFHYYILFTATNLVRESWVRTNVPSDSNQGLVRRVRKSPDVRFGSFWFIGKFVNTQIEHHPKKSH